MTTNHTSGPWCIPQAYNDAKNLMWANARLIAVAPEMLDALRRLTHPMANDEDLAYALEVIAKAEGGGA